MRKVTLDEIGKNISDLSGLIQLRKNLKWKSRDWLSKYKSLRELDQEA